MNLKEIEYKLISKTQYQGNKEPMQKIISASDFGNELLQIYLRYKYGIQNKEEFGQDTIGSIMHIGIQELLKNEYEIEKKIELKMDNDWLLSGSIDLMNDKEIIDIKVTKQYTIEKILKEQNHQYIWQLSVYKYLVKKILGKDLDTKLLLILKDGGYDFRRMEMKPSLVLLDIEPKSDKEIEEKFYNICSKIEQYEELGEYPQICSDLWWRKTKNQSIPVRCKVYCSFKDKCPYYKNLNPLNPMF